MSGTDAQAIVDVALASAQPVQVDPEERYVIVVPDDGNAVVIDPVPDSQLANPRRVSGTTEVLDVAGFEHLWKKHAEDGVSEVFATQATGRITAVLNADAGFGELAGHRDHRLQLQLTHTPEWGAWLTRSGKLLPQQTFAEFMEEHHADVYSDGDGGISGLEMLELAQTFQQKTKVDFKSSQLLSSGQRQFVYEEDSTAKAGARGQIDIPTSFTIAVSPYEGMDRYRLLVRFRYRIQNGELALGFKIERPEDTLRKAFGDVVEQVAEATGQPVLLGSPPSPR